jgi:hypothetical protein
MIDPDDLDPEAVALALGGRVVDDDPWSIREQRQADAEYFRALAALQRRERRERLAREIAVIKAMQKAGLPVRRATIEGVDLEFGQPEAAGKTPVNGTAGDFNEWDADLGTHPPEVRQ